MQISDFIYEGRADYEAMFRGFLNDPEVPEDYKTWIRNRIKWASQTLRKSDRVIWFLRYIKAQIMDVNSPPDENPPAGRRWVETFDPESLKPNQAFGYGSFATKTFWDQLAHFMSLDCPEIQNMVFGKTPVGELMAKLMVAEADWAKDQTGKIPADHPNNGAAEILIDFGNGWVWMNLNRASCSEEGAAMGHCGNSPRSHSGDTVLSLRKKVTRNGKLYYEPHLTFTMDEHHYLSERKGRANEKPAPRYQEMIVALLLLKQGKHWFIEGFGQSHWERHKDFVISDLSPELRAKVIAERPEFGNALEYWQGVGDEINPAVLEGKIMMKLQGRYQNNVKVNLAWNEVRCTLELPAYFLNILSGQVVGDPFTLNHYRASEVAQKRRQRVQELHGDELDVLLDKVIGESIQEARERLKDISHDLEPVFRIEIKQENCFAVAEIEQFLTALYASSFVQQGDSGRRTSQLIEMELCVEQMKHLMNGQARPLDQFAQRVTVMARQTVTRRIEELEREDIEKYGDVEGEKKPGDDLPTEDWEVEAGLRPMGRSRSQSIFDS